MLRNQRGNILFWVISAILFIAIALVLILPSKYNLDPQKNTDDCTTNMKNIWVATSDYLNDFQQDYYGDPQILLTTRKKDDPKNYYLSSHAYCPESQGGKENYIIFAKYSQEMLGSEMKNNSGILVFCPNLGKFPKHQSGRCTGAGVIALDDGGLDVAVIGLPLNGGVHRHHPPGLIGGA